MRPLTLAQPSTAILGLQDEIRQSAESRYQHRLHALLLVAQGMSCSQVAELLGDSRRVLTDWVHRFEAKGLAGLHERARGGRPARLTPEQVAGIQGSLQKLRADYGLSCNSWEGKQLAAYIKLTCGVKLGPRQCRRLLRQWGLRSVKRRRVIARRNAVRFDSQEPMANRQEPIGKSQYAKANTQKPIRKSQ